MRKFIAFLVFLGLFSVFLFLRAEADTEVSGYLTAGGTDNSNEAENLMGIVMTPPTASPAAGTYDQSQNIVLSRPSSAAEIRYTTDGTIPTCSSTANIVYSNPIPVNSSLTLKAISCYPENNASWVASFAYTITAGGTIAVNSGGGGGGYIPVATTIKGDIDGNSKVDKYDFSLMMANWGKISSNICDLNNDSKVDKYDFALLMSNWSI